MRTVRKITKEEENFRTVPFIGNNMVTSRKDPVEPEPVGTIILMPFKVVGYDPDCDGSLMARLGAIDKNMDFTGWEPTHLGLYPDTAFVVSEAELRNLFMMCGQNEVTNKGE